MSCYLTEVVERQLDKQLATEETTIWIALSGGLDSVVLLNLLANSKRYLKRLKAIHVHHGLSENADEWQLFCQQLCAQLNVPLTVKKVTVISRNQGLEQAARKARYNAFSEELKAGEYLITAHHGDDQIETFFQRLMRGAGIQGLSAMADARNEKHYVLLRPLLSCQRSQLADYANTKRLNWIEDESNHDQRFDRNWWRHKVLPMLWARYPGRQASVLRSIEQLHRDHEVLQELLQPKLEICLTDSIWPGTVSQKLQLSQLSKHSQPVQACILRTWFRLNGINSPSAIQLQCVFSEIIAAQADKQPELLLDGHVLRRFDNALFLCHAERGTHAQNMSVRLPESDDGNEKSFAAINWQSGKLQVKANSRNGDAEPLLPGNYTLMAAKRISAGLIRPHGRPAKKLKHIWQEHKIPPWLRSQWPCLVADNGDLVSVINLVVDSQYIAASGYTLSWGRQEKHNEK